MRNIPRSCQCANSARNKLELSITLFRKSYQTEAGIGCSWKTWEIIQGKSKCLGLEATICSTKQNVSNYIHPCSLWSIIYNHENLTDNLRETTNDDHIVCAVFVTNHCANLAIHNFRHYRLHPSNDSTGIQTHQNTHKYTILYLTVHLRGNKQCNVT